MERWVTEVLCARGAIRPGQSEGLEKVFVSVSDPYARFWCKPIQALKPKDGMIQTRVIENLRLGVCRTRMSRALPFVSVPLPEALVQLASREQAQTHGVFGELEGELG